MDFVVDLPESQHKTVIWTVKDLLSKQAHFIPCSSIPMAQQLSKLFLHHIYHLHGTPSHIILDCGSQFVSKFWKSFLKLISTEQGLSSSSHPQTDGATEIAQNTLEQFLRAGVGTLWLASQMWLF